MLKIRHHSVYTPKGTSPKVRNSGAIKFVSREEMLGAVKKIAKVKYDFDTDYIFSKSKLLRRIKTEKNLLEWF